MLPDNFDDSGIFTLINRYGCIHLLNTTIIPPGVDGVWEVYTIPLDYAQDLMSQMAHWGMVGFAPSHIGHEATAALATELLNVGKVDVDRTPWDGTGVGMAIQLNGRPKEGQILTREQMEEFGYTIRLLFCHKSFDPKCVPWGTVRVTVGGETNDTTKEI